MARRGREAALKRAREKARLEKREAKQAKKEARQADGPDETPVNEEALMEEFARLSERHENGHVSVDDYESERHRIFVELGIESED